METPDLSDPLVQRGLRLTERELNFQNHSEQFTALTAISQMLDSLRRAEELSDYRYIQQELSNHIRRVEMALGEAKSRVTKAERSIRSLNRRKVKAEDAEIVAVETELESAEQEYVLMGRLGRQYRTVGDAMAWQLYDFQSLVINALGMNNSPGPIGEKEGANWEQQKVEEYWRDHQAFALRHDLTNALRVWDLSVFYPDRSQESELVEVKSPKGRVKSKQRIQVRRISDLLRYKVASTKAGELLIHRAFSGMPITDIGETSFRVIIDAIYATHDSGLGTSNNDYFAVRAVNLLDPKIKEPDEDMKQKLLRGGDIPEELFNPSCEDYLVAYSNQKLFQLDSLGAPGYGAPYTIYPIPPDFAAAITTGYLRLVFFLNTCAVVKAFEAAGFRATFIRPSQDQKAARGGWPDGNVFRIERGDVRILLGAMVVQQILFEGLPLQDLVASVQAYVKEVDGSPPIIVPDRRLRLPPSFGKQGRPLHILTTFSGAEAIWRASGQVLIASDSEE